MIIKAFAGTVLGDVIAFGGVVSISNFIELVQL